MGWQAVVELPRTADGIESAEPLVHAVSSGGETRSLYSGSVAAACLRSAQLDTAILQRELARRDAEHRHEIERREAEHSSQLAGRQEQIDALARRTHAMEASRFWKARNLWFRFKRAAGLTNE